MLDTNINGIYNIGFDNFNFKKIEIVKTILDLLGTCELNFVDIVDPRDYKVSFAKLQRAVKCEYKYSLEDGIKELVNFLKSNALEKEEGTLLRSYLACSR
jgi:nucleoside-diphosphate-sugar epimerase